MKVKFAPSATSRGYPDPVRVIDISMTTHDNLALDTGEGGTQNVDQATNDLSGTNRWPSEDNVIEQEKSSPEGSSTSSRDTNGTSVEIVTDVPLPLDGSFYLVYECLYLSFSIWNTFLLI